VSVALSMAASPAARGAGTARPLTGHNGLILIDLERRGLAM
jgi:hypothetical protein